MKKIYGDYEYEQLPTAEGSPKTWLYRILKDGRHFYFKFEVGESIEKASLILPEIKTALETKAESLVHKFLDERREVNTKWILEPREPRLVWVVDWENELKGHSK